MRMRNDDDLAVRGRACPLRGTPYRTVRLIGSGTAAEVFEATGPHGERRAVKVLRATLTTARAAARFQRETRALAALASPHVVPVLDAGITASGRAFFVMPRLRGETLRERIRRARLDPRTACALLAGALDGLATAHRAGIVHRDVKPANVFVATAGLAARGAERAIVLDFGVAKVQGATAITTTGAHVVGTPRYLAPEQVLGGPVDARTDVYAMGLVLFEAIAGASPYEAKDWLGWMHAHLREQPKRLSEFRPIDPDVEIAIAKALEKPPGRRWPSADAFAAALRAATRSP